LVDEEGVLKAMELRNVAGLSGFGRDWPPPSIRDAALPDIEVPIALFVVPVVIKSPGFEQGRIDPVRASLPMPAGLLVIW
jgi:hypothetical protein